MLNFERTGSGPPLVLIHGLGADLRVWDPIACELSTRYDVIRLDLPGHGCSPRLAQGDDASPPGLQRSVSTFLDELNLGQVHVVGSSLGGWVSLELAAAGRASSVTALAPAGLWSTGLVPVAAHVNRSPARAVDPIAPALLRTAPLRFIGFWTSSANPARLEPDLAANATHAHAMASGWVRLDECGHMPAWDQPNRTVHLIDETTARNHGQSRRISA